LHSVLGNRKACAVREITKLHESVEHFNLEDGYPNEPRGEYVLLVEGAEEVDESAQMTAKEHLEKYLNEGMDKKEAVKKVAKERGVPKNEIYKIALDIEE